MRIERLTLGPVLCMATTGLGFLAFLSQQSFSSETARSITSMSVNDRMHLPDSTMVKLNSGRTVSLGTLRSEHNARMARFSRASVLGSSVAAKVNVPPAIPAQASAPLANVRPAPTPGAKGGGGFTKADTNVRVVPAIPDLVRFQPVPGVVLAKDYLDFCAAAHASACIYVPAETTFRDATAAITTKVMADLDPLIVDKSVCEFNGGVFDIGIPTAGCLFYYPYKSLVNFLPKGPLTTNVSCDPPGHQVVDPKGAVQAWFEYPGVPFTSGAKPITCVVQVWVGK